MTAIVYMGQRFEVDPIIDLSTFRWAAADDDGSLYIYSKAPRRDRHLWVATLANEPNCPPNIHFVGVIDKAAVGSVPYSLIGLAAMRHLPTQVDLQWALSVLSGFEYSADRVTNSPTESEYKSALAVFENHLVRPK